jgi:hypothetical protein
MVDLLLLGAAFVFASEANAGVLWVVEERAETGWWAPDDAEAKRIPRRRGQDVNPESVRAVEEEKRFRRWETRRVEGGPDGFGFSVPLRLRCSARSGPRGAVRLLF